MDIPPDVREKHYERICNSRVFRGESDKKRKGKLILKRMLESATPLSPKDYLGKEPFMGVGDSADTVRKAVQRLREDLKTPELCIAGIATASRVPEASQAWVEGGVF
jgi:hypothetical protein